MTPIEETLRFLDDAVSAGKITYYGFSNYVGWHIAKASEIAKAKGYSRPVTLQPQYSLLVRDIELEIVDACLDAGMGLLPWSPLGGGWLSGKYKRDALPSGATRLGENPDRGMEAYGPRNAEARTWSIIGTVEEIARSHGVTIERRWHLPGSPPGQPLLRSFLVLARRRNWPTISSPPIRLADDAMERLTAVSAPAAPDYPYGAQGVAQRHRKLSGGR